MKKWIILASVVIFVLVVAIFFANRSAFVETSTITEPGTGSCEEVVASAVERNPNFSDKDLTLHQLASLELRGCKNLEDLVQRFLSQGMSVNDLDREGRTPLHLATIFDNSELIGLLVKLGADVNAEGADRTVPLMYASNIETMKVLFENKAKANLRDSRGATALMRYAVQAGLEPEAIKLLISQGEDPKALDLEGKNALWYYFETSRGDGQSLAAFKLLVESGAMIDGKDKTGKTLLMRAFSQFRTLDEVRFLVDRGADIEAVDDLGKTALFYLIEAFGQIEPTPESSRLLTESLSYLKKKGINFNHKNKSGLSIMESETLAQRSGMVEVLKSFVRSN